MGKNLGRGLQNCCDKKLGWYGAEVIPRYQEELITRKHPQLSICSARADPLGEREPLSDALFAAMVSRVYIVWAGVTVRRFSDANDSRCHGCILG